MSHKRILMAIDAITTLQEQKISQRAQDIASRTGAEINQLHIKPSLLAAGMGGAIASLTEVDAPGKDDGCISEHGDAALLTDHMADELDADLIITAEHKSESFFLHRNDDKVLLRNAHQDMLFVKNKESDYRTIVCLIDVQQKGAPRLLEKAVQFANEFNAELHLLYVVANYPYAGVELLAQSELVREEQEFMQTCQEKLATLASVHRLPKAGQHIRVGCLTTVVKDALKTLGGDLLITANQQQHGLKKLKPSTPAKLIHEVECDFLAIYLDGTQKPELKRFYYH